MRWMEIANEQEGAGVAEIGGARANATIVGYFHGIGRPDVTSDEVAWCAAALLWCLKQSGASVAHIPEGERLLAVSGRKMGRRIDGPRYGAICVRPRPGGHHTAFVKSWTATTLELTGGNQADRFCTKEFKRFDADEFYWPDVPGQNDAGNSRIVAAANRQKKDLAKVSGTQVAPAPHIPDIAASAPVPAPAAPPVAGSELFPSFPPIDAVPGKLGAAQGAIEAVISFVNFCGAKWPVIMVIAFAYWGGRMAWDAWCIKRWRISDAATGKTIGAG